LRRRNWKEGKKKKGPYAGFEDIKKKKEEEEEGEKKSLRDLSWSASSKIG